MPLQVQLENGSLIGGGLAAFRAANVHVKPIDYGTLGHYRVVATPVLVAGQAANSRLFELRNAGSNLIVPTLIEVEVLAVGDVAPDAALIITMFGCTGFTEVDTVSTMTPVAVVMRSSGMSGAPGGAQIRCITPAGAAAGMSGWTAVKDGGAHSIVAAWMSSASADRPAMVRRFVCPTEQAIHPPVYATNQGLVIENVSAGSATSNEIMLVITVSWAEVTAY